jgi:hypothetical protein
MRPFALTCQQRIAARLEETVNELLYHVRERCTSIYKRRAALWGNTAMSSSALGQEKNRARTNHVHHGCH